MNKIKIEKGAVLENKIKPRRASTFHTDGVRSNFVEGSVWHEYYGFFLYLITKIGFACYFIWAFIPDFILEEYNIKYYPNKYWALAIPSFSTMFCIYYYILFLGYMLYHTPNFDSLEYLTDSHAINVDLDHLSSSVENDEIHDIQMDIVNKCLYY